MSDYTRGSNRASRPRISKSSSSGKNAGSGPESGNHGTHLKYENRNDPSKRGNWNDSLRKEGSFDRTARQRDIKNGEGRSYKSGNKSDMNLRREGRMYNPKSGSSNFSDRGKKSINPQGGSRSILQNKRFAGRAETGRSDTDRRKSSPDRGERRTYNPKSASSNISNREKKSINSPGGSRSNFQNRRFSGQTGTGKTGAVRRKSSPDSGEMRLNRFIAHSGICSRRQADEFIQAGLVSVNGQVVSDMGIKVKPEDIVKYNGESIRSEKKVYILLNKPKNYVTTLDDEESRKTVMELIKDACPERVYPVGRLDRNTTGVMLLTNDGDLTGKLTHPRYNKKKIYHVFLDKNLKSEDLKAITTGVTLEDGPITPDSISYVDSAKKSEIGIEIHSGRNRIVRRLFEYFGYKVIRLDRVYFAGLTKKNLPRGKWRFLTEKEIYTLKMNSYE